MQYCFLQFTPRRDDSHRYGSKIRVGMFNNIHYLNALRIILIVCKLGVFTGLRLLLSLTTMKRDITKHRKYALINKEVL